MAAVANNPAFAKKAGVPQSVGKDFADADKGKIFAADGPKTRADRQVVNQPKTNHGDMALFKKGGHMATKMGKPVMKPGMSTAKDGMKKPTPMAKTAMPGSMTGMKNGGMTKMGGVKTAAPSRDGVASKGKTKGMMPKMAGNKIGTGPAMKKGGMTKKYC